MSILNDGLPVSFVDEDNDMPAKPEGYGMAAWGATIKEYMFMINMISGISL
ncbi:hypothetical protein [Sphingobacterium sp. IITKGP-BTPF85]|uniref:hypothetical protein n=1 Tax=Sphingobacterium sp. IITKGP-BTPF85 TaxID=1338009 RepID=UPI000407A704|nr:hypothetical protein [Sphingobacterium sp. IITKGP-BTPF85]